MKRCDTPPQVAAWNEHHAVPTVAKERSTRPTGSNSACLVAAFAGGALSECCGSTPMSELYLLPPPPRGIGRGAEGMDGIGVGRDPSAGGRTIGWLGRGSDPGRSGRSGGVTITS